MGCEVAVNVVDVHETVMNEKKRTNSLMTLEQEKMVKEAIAQSKPHLTFSAALDLYFPDSSRFIPMHSDSFRFTLMQH
jgi:hypothetical protein